jgi:hypothetical protein
MPQVSLDTPAGNVPVMNLYTLRLCYLLETQQFEQSTFRASTEAVSIPMKANYDTFGYPAILRRQALSHHLPEQDLQLPLTRL